MKMYLIFGLILAVLIFSGCANNNGVGPSPSFTISISNASEYSDYEFYYVGNIWEDQLTLIADDTEVYKLNTHVTVYAVPKELNINKNTFAEISSKSVKSQQISLDSGNNDFEVSSFDTANGTMLLSK
ncbi:MAG: hypothetical protein V1672_00945 [Candidatus Diapherotrites archaeon]